MGTKDKFSGTLSNDKNQRSRYRRWSEHATVVGYDVDTQTYDIIIATEQLTGADNKVLNRVIRGIKSLLPADTQRFAPGDSIAVGYVGDQREHPVVLGQGIGSTSQKVLKVTLPTENEDEEVEGEEDVGGPTSPPLPPADIGPLAMAGDTVMDCAPASEGGVRELVFTASGGAPPYSWDLTGDGVLVVSGPSNNTATASPTGGSPSVGGEAYAACRHSVTGAPPIRCATGSGTSVCARWDCDDEFSVCNETCTSCGACPSTSDNRDFHCCTGGCGHANCLDIAQCIGSNCTGLQNHEWANAAVCDTRTGAQIALGCVPCGVQFLNAIITVTDNVGAQVSKVITLGN